MKYTIMAAYSCSYAGVIELEADNAHDAQLIALEAYRRWVGLPEQAPQFTGAAYDIPEINESQFENTYDPFNWRLLDLCQEDSAEEPDCIALDINEDNYKTWEPEGEDA